jgi:hypothetical protein
MAVVSQVSLLCKLKILTCHFEQPAGTEILTGLFSFTASMVQFLSSKAECLMYFLFVFLILSFCSNRCSEFLLAKH